MIHLFLSTLSGVVSRYMGRLSSGEDSRSDLDRLRLSLTYIKGIKSLRTMLMGMVAAGAALALFMTGLLLFVITLLFFTALSMEAKMYIGFAFAIVFIMVPVVVFQNVFSQSRWLDMFHAKDIVGQHDHAGV